MVKLDYITYRGKIYKRDATSMFTFSYKCKAGVFVNTLAAHERFKSRMLPQMKRVIGSLLRGALGFSVLRIWPIFDSAFRSL